MTLTDLAARLGLDPASVAAWPQSAPRRTTITCPYCGALTTHDLDTPCPPCDSCPTIPCPPPVTL
jgi:hypothetical protein